MYQGKYASNTKKRAPIAPSEAQSSAPVATSAPVAKNAPAKKKRKKPVTKGTIAFYGFYLVLIISLAIGIGVAMNMLGDWLVVFEASQPETKSQAVFEQLFKDPDWEQLYDMAGFQDTQFESRESYAAYMENKVGSQELTYVKTSAGLTGGHKYIIRLGEENLGTFTLQNQVEGDLEIPDWQLDNLELFMARETAVTVRTQPGHTVTLNGVAMNESHLVATTHTVLDDYAPEGYHGDRTVTYYTDGLLMTPEILITDENGKALEHPYDADTGIYYEVLPQKPEITQAQYDAVVGATKSYAKYMIGASGAKLDNYFNTSSDLYHTIKDNELWFKGYTGYSFSEETVSEYYRYSDDMFSARIQITLNVKRANGSIKEFNIDHTFFAKTNANGVWKVFKMTNADLQEVVSQVRLTFQNGAQVIHQDMYNANSSTLQTPTVTVPEGQQFLGWFREVRDENGDTTLQLMFKPDKNGKVSLPHGYVLEHMVLIARFGKEGA